MVLSIPLGFSTARTVPWIRQGQRGLGTIRVRAAPVAPQNATEAMLAVQMIAANDAALLFLRRATADGQTVEGSDGNVLRATRLMRLFTEQLAAMAKLKGKTGQQKVVVEHVHVHSGGQAVVGAVASPNQEQEK